MLFSVLDVYELERCFHHIESIRSLCSILINVICYIVILEVHTIGNTYILCIGIRKVTSVRYNYRGGGDAGGDGGGDRGDDTGDGGGDGGGDTGGGGGDGGCSVTL